MKPNSLYNASVKMIAELHCERREFWHNKWVENLYPDQGHEIMHHLILAIDALSQLRNEINEHTLAGESDDGESHLRGMEAFAAGGMDAYNEARGYGVVTSDD